MSSQQSQQHQQREELQKLVQSSSGQQQQQHLPSSSYQHRSVDNSPVISPTHSPYDANSNNGPNKTMLQHQPLSIDDGDLPSNVSTESQLAMLPDVCLSNNKTRPLRHVNEQGTVSTYALRPMFYSVIFILLVELLERFSFYGLEYTQTSFLTGAYDEDWNAGMTAIGASSYVSISTAVAYSMPFVGAYLADCVLGDYWSILAGSICFYLPGVLLITLSTIPHLLGNTFNKKALSFGLLCLWPMGTGIIKSIVNVFGAKQFHPLLQSSLIESYYVSFYMCINIGALAGGIVVPLVAQHDVTLAYSYPVAMLCIGVLLFLLGTPRYVRHPPSGELFTSSPTSPDRYKLAIMGDDLPTIPLTTIFRISSLIVPFNIAYSQMATTFIVQGTVMAKGFGFIDAASMNNADAISVLVFGNLVGSYIYPALANRNIKIPTTYKFALGSTLGAAAIAWALFLEYKIHSTYNKYGTKVNILWQALSYILIGAGEIFAVSAAYEVAFTSSPPEKKALASALNLFCVGGIPNILCIFLYNACRSWFHTSRGTTSIHNIEDYATAHVYKYFLVLFGIACLGIIINLLPFVKEYVMSIEETATEMVKTPVMKKRPKRTLSHQTSSTAEYSPTPSDEEQSPMLRVKRHQAYLKYGSGPVLYKSGSMRAGPSLSHDEVDQPISKRKKRKSIKKSQIGKLYRLTKSAVTGGGGGGSSSSRRPNVVMTPEGRPIKAGNIAGARRPGHHRQGSM